MLHLPAAHFVATHKPELLMMAGASMAGAATLANSAHIHDIATICGSLATIFTVLAAVLNGKRSKRQTNAAHPSRVTRRRKPRAIPPVSTNQKTQ